MFRYRLDGIVEAALGGADCITFHLREDRRHINTDSDSEVLLNIFAHELQRRGKLEIDEEDVFAAVAGVHRRCRGAYAAVAMITGFGIVAFRDPCGVRPLVYGKRETGEGTEYMIASESVALDTLGFELIADDVAGRLVRTLVDGELENAPSRRVTFS